MYQLKIKKFLNKITESRKMPAFCHLGQMFVRILNHGNLVKHMNLLDDRFHAYIKQVEFKRKSF